MVRPAVWIVNWATVGLTDDPLVPELGFIREHYQGVAGLTKLVPLPHSSRSWPPVCCSPPAGEAEGLASKGGTRSIGREWLLKAKWRR